MSRFDAYAADDALSTFREEASELLRDIEVGLNALRGAGEAQREALCRDILRWLHTLKGAASVVGKDKVRRYVHALEEQMRLVERGEAPLDEGITEISAGIADVRLAAEGPEDAGDTDEAAPSAQAPPARRASGELMRLRPEKVDALHALVGDLVVTRLQYASLARKMVELRDASSEAAGELVSFAAMVSALRGALPPNMHADVSAKLARVRESVSAISRDTSVVTRDLGLLDAQASAVSTSIEDGIRELRLVPLESFFEGFSRVVLETARETGKEAQLIVSAGGAEIDRAVMMKLQGPLAHLVRNAVFHGIEPPDVRAALGKSRSGLVRLEGHCERSRAIVRVVDDGAGIDRESVRRKAERQGLTLEGGALSDEVLLEVLSQPGFSTRDAADGLAGRGIGLDAAASAVRALDGRFELATEAGVGTVFTLEVPVTASTGLGLVVTVGEHAFGILLNSVERAIRVSPAEIEQLLDRDTVTIDGVPVGIVSLASLVGVSDVRPASQKVPAVVLRSGKQRLVVTVDDVPGDQALVVKPLGRAFADATHLSGAAVQPDGSTLPVLHVPALFSKAAALASGHVELPARARAAESGKALDGCVVLVVDDSMTMRTLLRNILRADRYEVAVAHDGKAAMDVLAALPRCDLVVTDLEMPLMNGVELCKAIRRSARAHVPIMVVTSVGDPEEKQRALESGADAFVVKSDFEQGRFLEVVARLSGGPRRRV
jgi:two-component system, chemotaxis family, sensor kinase CheA